MGEGARPIVMVNFPQLMSHDETTTQNIYACVEEHGVIIKNLENNTYIYLNLPATPTLQTLYRDLQSQQRQMVTYANAIAVEANVRYNHKQADAAQAITTAEIYLQTAVKLPTLRNSDEHRSKQPNGCWQRG